MVNLLDTPGHKDFSEDTYRVLTAVDAAVMVIDAGKGIESQTRKLFEVCRRRGVPIFTFMNKMDRPARPSLDLLDELESVLGIHAFPINWPLGDGPRFKGVYDREQKQVHLFERTVHGAYRAPVAVTGIEDDSVKEAVDEATYRQVCDELEMLEGAGADFDVAKVLAGELTPVFFGSAANNFGVQLLLDRFLELAPPPPPRASGGSRDRPGVGGVLRLRLQDPGEHGPEAPRPHGLRAHRLRQIRARHERAQHPQRRAHAPRQLAAPLRPRARDRGRRLRRRCRRAGRQLRFAHRRHARHQHPA